MENASKALIMAGGVLLAILLIGALVYTFTHIRGVPQSEDELRASEQLAKENKEFESYSKGRLWSTDVISVINKARDIDNKNNLDSATSVKIQVNLQETINFFGSRNAFYYEKGKISGQNITADSQINSTLKEAINGRIFKCTNIGYSSNGRINYMEFNQVDKVD